MPNFRYPIAPPSQAVSDPFSVAFDYLPTPLHHPLTAEEEMDLYTTRITVSAAAAAVGADRIAHVFPRTNVRFLMNDGSGLVASALAQRYLDDADQDPLPIRGAWISLGLPVDVRDIRATTGSKLFPTVVIYHEVIIDRQLVQQTIVPLLRVEKVVNAVTGQRPSEITDIATKLTHWLSGEFRVSFPDVDNPPAELAGQSFLLPQIPLIAGEHSLSVSALEMDGSGVGANVMAQIIADLRQSFQSGELLRNSRAVIHMPVSYIYLVLPTSELSVDHAAHPLASAWPAPPANWNAAVFSFTHTPRGDVTELQTDGRFTRLRCQVNDEAEFPLARTGLFFFRSAQTANELKVFEQPDHLLQPLSLFTRAGAPVMGTSLTIDDQLAPKGLSRVLVGALDGIPGTADHYFGVAPSLDNLQAFIDAVSALHLSYFTTAGAFARTMGFFAEAVANHLSTQVVVVEATPPSEPQSLQLLVPPSGSFRCLLAVGYRLLIATEQRAEQEDWALTGDIVTLDLRSAGIDLSSINRPSWMNNHEDGAEESGFKVFVPTSNDMAGRKDHFLFNSAMRSTRPNFYYYAQVGIFNFFVERDQTDKRYNEKGAEFAEWGMSSDYRPERVEQWILNEIVDRATMG